MRLPIVIVLALIVLLSLFAITEAQSPWVDRLVNNRTTDTYPRITQSETSIAAVGSTVVVGWNDTGHAASCSGQGYGRSADSGATWTDQGFLPTGTSGGVTAAGVFSDPVLGSNDLGDFFFAALANEPGGVCGTSGRSFIGLWRSQDDGVTFQYLADASPGTAIGNLQDKEEMAIDKSPTSPFLGNIYVCWTEIVPGFFMADMRIRVSRSTDGGVSFSSPTTLRTVTVSVVLPSIVGGCALAVAPDGKVYAAWAEGTPSEGATGFVTIRRSDDGGVAWTSPVTVGTGLHAGDPSTSCLMNIPGVGTFPRPALKGEIRDAPIPTLAVSPDGQVNLAVTQGVFDAVTSSHLADVVYTRSTNFGTTWDPLITVNSDSTNDQFQPRLTVHSDGTIAVIWYDRRHDPANLRIHVREGVSFDGGTTWHDFQVTDTDFEAPPINVPITGNFDPNVAECYMGDYNAIIAHGDQFLLAWGDNREDTSSYAGGPPTPHPDPDIQFEAQIAADIDNDSLGLGDPFGLFFRNSVELLMGTLPTVACPATSDINDEPDATGADFDDSRDVDGSDVFLFAQRFGTELGVEPPEGKLVFDVRFDIYPTAASLNKVDGSDVFVLATYFGDSCV